MAYKNLKTYQNAVIIHDFTAEFVKKHISQFSRTVEQMIQAARSGSQNIVEGSEQQGGATELPKGSKNEHYLLGIARGSLKELQQDYEDILRQNKLPVWSKEHARAQEVRQLAYRPDRTHTTYKPYIADREQACNAMLCLINQTTYLIDQQRKAIEKQMLEKGVSLETHAQKVRRIMATEKKREQEVDAMIKETMRKEGDPVIFEQIYGENP